jgi:predicted MFS family arabinose efflux permease
LVLTIAGLVALAGQIPGGALVDAARSERLVAALAIGTIGASALILSMWPIFPVVLGAITLQAAAVCVLGPAIAAISLGLVGHADIGERLGRNARFASLGTGLSALAMGATGYFLSNQAVFLVTAAFILPALISLLFIREQEIDAERAHGGLNGGLNGAESDAKPHKRAVKLSHVLRRPLLILAGCVMLFQLANAAMLPLLGGVVTMRSSEWATVLVAASIVVPQLVVVAVGPTIGRRAKLHGRRPLLLIGFAAVAIRGLLFAVVSDPYLLVVAQVFDGIAASVFTVMVPFVVADITRGSGRFNLSLGIVGTGTGIGASLSTSLAGYVSDHLGSAVAFLGLAGIAALGFAVVFLLMPETRPAE